MATVVEQLAAREDEGLITEFIAPPKPAPPAKLTLEQANKLAAGRPFELIQGRMVFKMPDNPHSESHALLGAELVNYFKANPIGRVRIESTVRLWPDNPHEGRVPDIAVVLNENIREGERYDTRAPDLAIEIISRDDAWSELFDKADLYFEKGSRVVWFVDPYRKGVLVVTPDGQRWVKDTLACPELLPGFAVNVQDIFTWPAASTKAGE
jgi:Uma2 family endonuclease